MKKLLAFLLPLALMSYRPHSADKGETPNIVLIFIDDLGYGDVTCNGALDYRTPMIDQLAKEGMRFTNFLTAQAVCSASRAGLLTGCYPNRIGFSGALFPNAKVGISDKETTIADMLKKQGYATCIIGKWHLGDQKPFLPLQHGFDEYLGITYSNDMWPMDYDGKPATDWRKSSYPTLPLIEGNAVKRHIESLDDQGMLTSWYTERAVDFIRRNKNNPFFLYLPHSMVHVPINASPKFRGKSGAGLFGDVMMELDWSIGEVMKTLKENGLDDNTLVIFTSDNGPWINFGNHAGNTAGFREAKGVSFEGGQRVPCIMRWPGHIPEGVICNQLSSTIDILPTIARITHADLPKNKIDGVDISRLLEGHLDETPRTTFFYYYRKNNLEAVRRGNWKLVLPHRGRSYEGQLPGNDGHPGPTPEDVPVSMGLYDLRRDPGEEYDVQSQYPEKVDELLKLADLARKELGDELVKTVGAGNREIGRVE